MTLDDLWDIVLRRKGIIVAVIAVAFSLAILYCATAKRLYKSSAVIQVQKDSADALSLGQILGQSTTTGDALDANITLQTEAQILESESLALQVIKELSLEHTPDFQGGGFSPIGFLLKPFTPAATPDAPAASLDDAPGRRTHAIRTFEGHLKVKPRAGTRLIALEYLSTSPRTAAAVVNQLVDDLRNYNFTTRQDATKKASEWLQDQLSDLRKRAEDAQSRVASLQRSSGIFVTGQTDTQGREQTYTPTLDRLQQTTAQLGQAESARIMKGALYEVVKDGDPELISSLAGNSTLSGASSGLSSSLTLLQNLRAQEAQTQAQLNELSSKFGSAYPKLAEVQASLDATRKAIADETARIAARVRNDYSVAQKVEETDRTVFEQERAHAEALNNKAVEYQIARQEAEQASSLYQNLLQRMKEADLVADLRSSNITIVDKGLVSARPAKPNVIVALGGGLVGGFVLGVCGALFREATDRRIQDLDTFGSGVSSMPLAFVPLHAPRKQKRLAGRGDAFASLQALPRPGLPSLLINPDTMVAAAEPRSAYAESLRALRTTLLQSGGDRSASPQSMVVTSSLPGEGKSMLSINLAIVYAQRGKRVLLVDADLRTPVLHKRLGILNEQGLSDALSGPAPVQPIEIPIGGERVLHFLGAGSNASYPAELLASDDMVLLMDRWREDYDYVFIDSAPLLPVTDAAILGRRADFTLVVARHNVTDRRSLERTCHILRSQGVQYSGVVLNAVRASGSDQYRYYGIDTQAHRKREQAHA